MSLLKVAAAELIARYLSSDGKHRNAIAMTIEEAVNQVKIARTATASANGDLPGEERIGTGRESRHLFMPYMQPLDVFSLSNDIGKTVERIAD
jgi:hypothetical protein